MRNHRSGSLKKRMQKHRLGLGFCAALVVLCQDVGAIEASDLLLFSWEPVTLKPQLALAEVYNDNLFSHPTRKQADLTTVISPGLIVLVGKRTDDHLSLSYTFNQYFYADRTDLDTSEHLIEFSNHLEGKRIGLRGTDRVQFLSSPVGTETKVLDPQAVDRPFVVTEANIERLTLYDNYTLSYRTTEKTSVYAQGLHSTIDYEEGVRLTDITTYSVTGGFGFQAFPKTVVFGETYYGTTSSEPNTPALKLPDVTFFGGALGARGNFTPKLAGIIRAGYETRELEDGTSLPGAPIVNLGLTYQYSPKTTFSLNYIRRQDVSIYFEQQSYVSDVVSVSATQALGSKGKWRATLGGYYGLYDYTRTATLLERNYDVYVAYFTLAYQIQLWLTASLSYDRTSVLGGSREITAYDVNRVTLRLSVGY